MLDQGLILGDEDIVSQRREPRPIAQKLLATVEGFGGRREYLDDDGGIEHDILDLVMELERPTDDHEVRIGIEPFMGATQAGRGATAHFGVFAEGFTGRATQLRTETRLGRDKARCLVGTFPHLPRLEPYVRLSRHTA